MKTTPLHAPSALRSAACLAGVLGLGIASIFASPSVSLNLNGKEFGVGKSIHVTSGAFLLSPSTKYAFKVVGTCHGTGALAKVVPNGTPVVTFFNQLSPGIGASFSGTYSNPGGGFPFTVINKTPKGTKTLPKIGPVTLSAKVVGGALANGQVYLDVTKVKFTAATPVALGTIVFEKGAKLVINRVPEVQFQTSLEHVSESAGSVKVTVLRYGFSKGAVSVHYTMADGTATSSDYTASSGTLNFADGATTGTITVPIKPNTINDGFRRFTITLDSPTGGSAILGTRIKNTVVIDDDD